MFLFCMALNLRNHQSVLISKLSFTCSFTIMSATVDLKPQKDLLNPLFESYKLSLDNLPSYYQELEKGVDKTELSEDQVTSHHTKLFGAHNHLICDPWSNNHVYFIDTAWAVRHAFVKENGKVDVSGRVFDIPEASEFLQTPGRLNVSLCFTKEFAVLADGAGRLFLLNANERENPAEQWMVLLKERVLGESAMFSVVDACSYSSGDQQRMVDCLLVGVESGKEGKQGYLTVLTWITLTTGAEGKWGICRTRRLEGSRPFDYASVERGGGAVTIASNRPFTLTADSVKEVTPLMEGSGDWEVVGKEPQHPVYTWSQTGEEVRLQLTLPSDASKEEVYVRLAADHLDIGVKGSVTLLKGSLPARIDMATATWSVEGQQLEVCLMKEAEGGPMWDTMVVGDSRGEMTVDEEAIAAIHQRLKHLTSDKWNPDPDPHNRPFNTQQLEECDAFEDEDCIYLMRIDGETHRISHQATVRYCLLFNVQLEAGKAPALCLRHDVDGLVWQPEPVSSLNAGNPCPWRHVGTLDAFGFVQASKVQRRFSSCSSDFSLAAIADCSRHVYLYRQRAPISSPLRNRRTSQSVSSIAKQHVVVMDPPDPLLGLHVTRDHVFLATAARIHAVKVSQDA